MFEAFQCPAGAADDLYPDPVDCGHFYSCVGTTAYRMTCPSGLQFNVDTKNCDYPSNAKCPRPATTTKATTTTTQATTTTTRKAVSK